MARTSARTRAAPGCALDALHFALDRTSPVPLYHQLAQQLEKAIERGVLAPGNLLGNEIDLSARLGLSRPTVRQAIQSLVDKGLLVRRRGVGTQVVHSQVKRPLELSSLYDDLEAAGQRPTTRVVRNERVPATADVAAALAAAEGSEVTLLERLRGTHGQPVAFLSNYLSPAVPDFDTGRLESTGLYRLLRTAGVTCTAPARRWAPAPPPPRRPPSSPKRRGRPC
ncbi:GntR family transcriptional regulator [Streptomyces sp. B4I13]|nr:GntR family transcriptional regulator [Streptomyces sp. B4I13]